MSGRDEVELDGGDEDYEVVPVGPLRKLERRVDELQEQTKNQANSSGGASAGNEEMIKDVIDIMKSNQKIVNDMTESTHELKNSVEDLTHKMDEVVDNMNQFMDLLTEASEMDMEGEMVNDMEQRVADAIGGQIQEVADEIKQSNQQVIQNLNQINQSLGNSTTQTGSMTGGGNSQTGSESMDVGGRERRTQSERNEQINQMGGNNDNRMEKLKERFNQDRSSNE